MAIQVGDKMRVLNGDAALGENSHLHSESPDIPVYQDFESQFLFKVGDRVLVEVVGTVKVRQETEFGLKYIVEPDNPRATAVHASPEYVFPLAEDDDDEPTEAADETIAA